MPGCTKRSAIAGGEWSMSFDAKAEWSTDAGSCGSGAHFSLMNDEMAKETGATGEQNEKAHGSFIPLC